MPALRLGGERRPSRSGLSLLEHRDNPGGPQFAPVALTSSLSYSRSDLKALMLLAPIFPVEAAMIE